MYASLTAFYMDVTGEMAERNRKHTQEMTHWTAETLSEKRTEDDYDSEA